MKFISIGAINWGVSNLAVTAMKDGSELPLVTSFEEWKTLSADRKPCCCAYDFDPKNQKKFGLLYNPFAIENIQDIIPDGTRLPARADWDDLLERLGGNVPLDKQSPSACLLALKSEKGWRRQYVQGMSTDMNGDNTSGFNALPGGDLFIGSSFREKGFGSVWWTSEYHKPHITQYDKHVFCFQTSQGISDAADGSCSGAYIRLVQD